MKSEKEQESSHKVNFDNLSVRKGNNSQIYEKHK
jgi:hypothetical protein